MSSKQRRVVITGVGSICPLGSTKEALWNALVEHRSGVVPLTVVPEGTFPMKFAAQADQFTGKIDDFGPLEKDAKKAIRKGLKVMCRECQMGVAAAQLALTDADLKSSNADSTRTGITFGVDYMLTVPDEFAEGVLECVDESGEFQFARWASEGMPKMSPLWLLKYLPNMPASHLAIYNQFHGPNNSLTLREAAANAAIGEAYHTILGDRADVMLVGATGTRLHPMKMVHALQHEQLATGNGDPTKLSRPFDRDRAGMVLGEGAAAIVLEELSAAKARGATIYGEVVGNAASSAVGRHMQARRGRALANSLRNGLASAGIAIDELGHVSAHGISTTHGDAEEAQAIGEVLGARADSVPVVACKSYFGNLGAASGMVELIASLLAMQQGRLFPVLNYEHPDPECPVAVVQGDDVSPGDSFVNLSVTPQGQAAAVVVRRID